MTNTLNTYHLLARADQDTSDVSEFDERLELTDVKIRDEVLHNVALLVNAGFTETQAKIIIMRLSKFMNLPEKMRMARVQNGKMIAQMINSELKQKEESNDRL